MVMCSKKKRSSTGVALWCVVVGLALLAVDAAGKEGGGRAGYLAEEHGDAAYCSALCKGRVTGQEQARGGGGVVGRAGLLAMPTERTGGEGEEKGKQEDPVARLSDPVWCYDACREHPELDYTQCVNDCYAENMPDAAQLAAHGGTGGEEARGGAVDGLTVVGKPHCDWFRDCTATPCVWRCGKRAQEEDAPLA
uniref:Uncharacterized protein n=1 Tax=Aegilops tauschii TaxID=37682 RepID=R7WGK1_AEGTA